jgi:hypothetical protein
MIYLKNYNKAGGGFYLKNIYSSKRILENDFPKNETFNFIQVGANDSVSFDFLYNFFKVILGRLLFLIANKRLFYLNKYNVNI